MRFRSLADDWLVSSAAFVMSAKAEQGWELIQTWFKKAESGRSSPLAFQQSMTISILSGRLKAVEMPDEFAWTCTTRLPVLDPVTSKLVQPNTYAPIAILHLGELRRLRMFDFPTKDGAEVSLPLDVNKLAERVGFSPA